MSDSPEQRAEVLLSGLSQVRDAVLITEAEPQQEPGPRILYANAAFEKMTGYTVDEVLGRSPRILQGPQTDRAVLARMGEAMRRWQPVHAEVLNYRKDGSTYWAEIEIVPVANADGWYTHWVAIERDISARKALEQGLVAHNAELEERVRLRTVELQAQKERADEANRAKSEFLANMSHELRSPLHSILGFTRLAIEDGDALGAEQLRNFLGRIDRNARNLLSLVNDLLDSAKIESRSFSIAPQEMDLADTLRQVRGEFPQSPKPGLTLVVDAPSVAPLSGDPQRIAQVVRNLLANAIRFSPADTQVDIRLVALDGGEAWELAIEDQGPGIPPDELSTIFQRFTQSSFTKTGAGGTGLGLAIAQGIVELHGGRIHAENRHPTGARFVVRLPARPPHEG